MKPLTYPDLSRRLGILWEHRHGGINPAHMVDVNRPTDAQVAGDPDAKPAIPPMTWTPCFEWNDPNMPERVAGHLADLPLTAAKETLKAVALDQGYPRGAFVLWGLMLRRTVKEFARAA